MPIPLYLVIAITTFVSIVSFSLASKGFLAISAGPWARFAEVYKAWATLNFTHRAEVQYLEDSFGMLGIQVQLTQRGVAVQTLKNMWGAAQSLSNFATFHTAAKNLQALM